MRRNAQGLAPGGLIKVVRRMMMLLGVLFAVVSALGLVWLAGVWMGINNHTTQLIAGRLGWTQAAQRGILWSNWVSQTRAWDAMGPGTLVLLGDSQMVGLPPMLHQVLAPEHNGGRDLRQPIVNLANNGMRWVDVPGLPLNPQPWTRVSTLILGLGVNDFLRYATPAAVERIARDWLGKAPADARVICLLPAPPKGPLWRHAAEMPPYVQALRQACESRPGVQIVDLGPVFSDNGVLSARFDVGDGLHWNAQAYTVVAQMIRDALLRASTDAASPMPGAKP